MERIKRDKPELEIALVGKYIELPDAYLSVTEALKHAGWAHDVDVKIRWVDSETLSKDTLHAALDGAAGVVVPGGFGHRGIEGRSWPRTSPVTRSSPVPRAVPGPAMRRDRVRPRGRRGGRQLHGVPDMFTTNPVIDFMPDQRDLEDGTMRLGLYPAKLTPGSKAAAAYWSATSATGTGSRSA